MWLVSTLAVAACPELVPRQRVGNDPTWLEGDVPAVWADGTLWWLAPDGLRSTAVPPGRAGRPVGRRGDQVLWGTLRDDMSTWQVDGLPWPVSRWFAVGEGALVLGTSAEGGPLAAHLGPDGGVTPIPTPATPGAGAGLAPFLREGCERALGSEILAGPAPAVVATACSLPGPAWRIDPAGAARALPTLPGSLLHLAGSDDRLAAAFVDESGEWPVWRLAWATRADWTLDAAPLAADRVIDLVVVDDQRATAVTHAGDHVVRCEATATSVVGGGTFGGHPLSSTPSWGLATLARQNESWWIVSTRAPSTP